MSRTVSKNLALSFDHHSTDFARHRFEVYARLREQCPVMHSEQYGGFWVVTDFRQGRQVLRDDEHFICARDENGKGGLLIPELARAPQMRPGELDGREHLAYRAMLKDKFSPQTVATLRPRITALTTAALDAVLAKESFDVVADIADVVPIQVMFQYLGVPESNYEGLLSALESGFASSPEAFDRAEGASEFKQGWDQILSVVGERRGQPRDDLISHMTAWQDPALSDDDIASVVLNLALGGIRTVAALISYTLYHLEENRDQRAWLIAHPEQIAGSVEEFVRFFAPAVAIARTAVDHVAVSDTDIEAGDRVLVAISAANRDPAVYDNPETIDLTRTKKQNLSFGIGAHYCPGVHLARLEFDVLLTEILSRIPDYVIDLDQSEEAGHLGVAAGWVRMPARVRP